MIHLTGPFEARTFQGASFVTDPGHPLKDDKSKLGGSIDKRPAGQEFCGPCLWSGRPHACRTPEMVVFRHVAELTQLPASRSLSPFLLHCLSN
jgi:hypothetical protein